MVTFYFNGCWFLPSSEVPSGINPSYIFKLIELIDCGERSENITWNTFEWIWLGVMGIYYLLVDEGNDIPFHSFVCSGILFNMSSILVAFNTVVFSVHYTVVS